MRPARRIFDMTDLEKEVLKSLNYDVLFFKRKNKLENMDKKLVEGCHKLLLLQQPIHEKLEIKAYKRRWWILFLYMYYSCLSTSQCIEYSSITSLVVKYYNVSSLAVDWTSTIYMALYPILALPAAYIVNKKGLRTAGLMGCIGALLGACLKNFSVRTDCFWLVLIGQAIVGAAQTVILCLPPKIAANWFKANEVSTACSLGVFGNLLGLAVGYIVPTFIVQDSDNVSNIEEQLKILCWLLTCSLIPVTVAVVVYFPNEPTLPPSITQAVLKQKKNDSDNEIIFSSILRKLLTNKGFVILMIGYSINNAVCSAIGVLLNQFILYYFKDAHKEAGLMGFLLVIAGMMGCIIYGIILDLTHKYKELTIYINFCSALSVLCLMFALKYTMKKLTYISCILIGLFTNAFIAVGFELAIELVYPCDESTTSGILNTGTQAVGVVFIVIVGLINKSFGPFLALSTQAGMLFVSTIVTMFIPNILLRQEARKQNQNRILDKKSCQVA